MATSGTFVWNPDLAEILDEAFERARIDPAHLTARHILSARRSMSFMLSDWATKDYHDFRIVRETFTVVESQAAYVAGTDFDTDTAVVDIINMALRRDGVDTPVGFMSRQQLLDIPEKTTEGRPDRVFVDKQRDGITLTFWPVPENSTDVILFDKVLKFEDHDTAADNPDIHYYMRDAFVYGLAFRIAEKFSPPELEQALYGKAENAFITGSNASRERGDIRIIPSSGRRRIRGTTRNYS